jgi:hypothetical protein
MNQVIFIWYVVTGVITPTDNVDGRATYTIKQKDFIVEYAYRGEVLNWIESDKFIYDETLKDK